MSTKRRLVAFLDRRLARRLIIVPVVLVAAFIAVVTSPLLLFGAYASDVVKKRLRRPRTRLTLLVVGALIIEAGGILTSFLVWIASGFGVIGPKRWRWQQHRRFMGAYTNTMLSLIARVLGVQIDWRDNADLSTGPLVLLARHTSFFDALIPATVLSHRASLLSHHVVTHGLRYAPCIDIVGHRFPNQFIKRSPGEGSSQLAPIQQIGAVLDERSAGIIFPEGTFRNPARFERAVRKLRRRKPDLAARCAALDHVLPPQPNGTAALIAGNPEADIVVCTNTGLEPFGSIKQIVDDLCGDRPIIVETWRIPRAQVPTDPDQFHEWLFEQYVAIDTWVDRQTAET